MVIAISACDQCMVMALSSWAKVCASADATSSCTGDKDTTSAQRRVATVKAKGLQVNAHQASEGAAAAAGRAGSKTVAWPCTQIVPSRLRTNVRSLAIGLSARISISSTDATISSPRKTGARKLNYWPR